MWIWPFVFIIGWNLRAVLGGNQQIVGSFGIAIDGAYSS